MTAARHRSLLARIRMLRGYVIASVKGRLGMERSPSAFSSQQMCPFCGRITSRYESNCLECGKSLK